MKNRCVILLFIILFIGVVCSVPQTINIEGKFINEEKIYKDGCLESYNSFRTVMIFPGDLVVAGCFNFSGGFF